MSIETITQKATYLTFVLEQEQYAINVNKVKEILELTTITKVPRTPEYMRGVINLRGNVVPVIDLKFKLGMNRTEETSNTCIIVMEITIDEGEIIVVGALADLVQEVIELEPGQIDPVPKIGIKLDTEFILGMGKKDEHFIIILDIDNIFTKKELAEIGTKNISQQENKEAAEEQ